MGMHVLPSEKKAEEDRERGKKSGLFGNLTVT
jgi:hypothetical protein